MIESERNSGVPQIPGPANGPQNELARGEADSPDSYIGYVESLKKLLGNPNYADTTRAQADKALGRGFRRKK